MHDPDIPTYLRRIGAGCFVLHMDLWLSSDTDREVVAELRKRTGYSDAGCKIRVSHARKLIREPVTLRKALTRVSRMSPLRVSDKDVPRLASELSRLDLTSGPVRISIGHAQAPYVS